MGCLLAPVRAVGCLVIIAALVLGWLYRDRLIGAASDLIGGGRPGPTAVGRPGSRALAAAKARTDSLGRGSVDSVVLSAAETASLIGSGIDPTIRRELDSLEVRLLEDKIEVGARLATDRIPRAAFGPFGFLLPEHARVSVTGPIRVVGPGRGEWQIDRLGVGGVPLPIDAVGSVLGRALGERGRRALPVGIPRGVRDIRIRPTGAVLFGVRRP